MLNLNMLKLKEREIHYTKIQLCRFHDGLLTALSVLDSRS
jgi:hypothetical protein